MDRAAARRLLSVDASASRADLKKAYRAALKVWHPDRAHGVVRAGDALEQTQRINAAYAVLASEPVPGLDVVRDGASWSARPIRTIESDWWPLRVITSSGASMPAGVLLFGLVWAILAGLAGAFETLLLS